MKKIFLLLGVIAVSAAPLAAEPPYPTISAGERAAAEAAKPAPRFNDPPALVVEGWEKARCATVEYAPGVKAALCWPAEPSDKPLPIVLFVFNYNHAAFVADQGKPTCDMVPQIIWMAEMANRGFLAVCPDPQSVAPDMAAMMKWLAQRGAGLGADPSRMALFSVSANCKIIPYLMGLPEAANVKAMALYYSDLAPAAWSLPKTVALHVVKAGKDTATMNTRMDAFVKKFTEAGNAVDFIVYPAGDHVFDWKDEGGEAAAVMATTLDFLDAKLR